MNRNVRARAEGLRRKGYSYNLISHKLGIGKGTLSYWLRTLPYTPNETVRNRIVSGPQRSAQKRHNEKVQTIIRSEAAACKEIGALSRRDLHMIGLGLYLGEGGKSNEKVRVVNSDPKIMRLMIDWFKGICELTNENITIALHLYPDNNEHIARRFWSKATGLPLSNFRKTQFDRRTDKKMIRRHMLPHGTAHVTIIGAGNPNHGVALFRRISGWMNAVVSAGVV